MLWQRKKVNEYLLWGASQLVSHLPASEEAGLEQLHQIQARFSQSLSIQK